MPRGGYHPNAERWGRKSAWQNESPTKTIRVPEALIEQVLDYAHKLDVGEIIDYDTKAKNEIEQLRQERARLAQELAACRASQPQPQPQQLDLEAIRNRVVKHWKIQRRAESKERIEEALSRFIAELRSLQG
jgi:hypothetical protein